VLALTVTGADDLVLVASTNGAGFPTTAGSFSPAYNGGTQDLVVSKLSADGRRLLGSTHLGGGSDETLGDVAVDAAGRIMVAGTTYSFNFPATAGALDRTRDGLLDGFVTCFAPDLAALAWSTLLGGQSTEIILDLALARNGEPVLLGTTGSPDFPVSAGAFQPTFVPGNGFLTRLQADGAAVVASTFLLRLNLSDTAAQLAMDAADNPYVMGSTFDSITPTPGCMAAGGEVFVAKFDAPLRRQLLLARTDLRLGLGVHAFEVDECESLHIAGVSYGGIPIVNPLPNSPTTFPPGSSVSRMFSLTLDARLARWTFGSYFGTLGHFHSGRARFDKQGRLYANSCVLNGAGFPTTPGAYATTTRNGPNRKDVVAYVIDQGTGPGPAVRAATPAVAPGCAPYAVSFANASTGSARFTWSFGDGSAPDTARAPRHTFAQPGTYRVRLVAYGRGTGCSRNDTATAQMLVSAPVAAGLPRAVVLCGSQATVDAGNPGASYQWSTGVSTRTLAITQPGRYRVRIHNGACTVLDSVDVRRLPPPALGPEQGLCPGGTLTLRPTAEPGSAFRWNTGALTPTLLVTQPGRYSVHITTNGCTVRDSVVVRAVAPLQLGPDTLVCAQAVVRLAPRGVAAGSTFQWSTGETAPAIAVQTPGTYSVRVTTSGCTQTLTRRIETASTELPPNIITPNHDGANDTFRPTAVLSGTRLWVYNRWGREVYHSDNYANEWSAPGLPAGNYFYRLVNEGLCEKQLKGWLEIVR
jgi:gliding motility-associated-like protein